MSKRNRSLACEEIKAAERPLVDLLPMRHLSLSNVSSELEPVCQVIKVSGNITVSF